MSDVELKVRVPLDNDGFVRRACPSCKREFKWLLYDDSEPMPGAGYACPYCAGRATSWFTEAQLAVAYDALGREVVDPMLNEFGDAVRKVNAPGSFVRFEVEVSPRGPKPTFTEPNDMVRVEPGCHPKEPLKVSEDWTGVVHCIICASAIRGAA